MIEQDYNFFSLLEMDPDAPWSQETFQKILSQKQRQWTRESMDMGADALYAKKLLEQISEIKRVMNDDIARTQYIMAIHGQQAEYTQRRLEEFGHQLHLLEDQRSEIDEREITSLVNAFSDILSEDEIYQQINLPVVSKDEEDVASDQSLSPTILQEIDNELALLHLSNLYELLHTDPGTNSQELQAFAIQLFEETARRQPKNAEVSATMRLAGHARIIFGTPRKQQEYDQHVYEQLKQPAQENIYHFTRPPVTSTSNNIDKEYTESSPLALSTTISDLRAKNIGRALQLTWRWPVQCNEVLLSYADTDWSDTIQFAGKQIHVMKAEYELGGHYDLPLPINRPYFIRIAPVKRKSNVFSLYEEACIQGFFLPQVHLSYEIRNPRFGYKSRTLHIFSSPHPIVLPITFLLRWKQGELPLNKRDGTLLACLEGPHHIQFSEYVVPIIASRFEPQSYARLFLEDDTWSETIRLRRPDDKKLRLG